MPDPPAAFLIYNPVAGKIFRQPQLIQDAVAVLQPALGKIHLRPTTGPQTAGAIAQACIRDSATLILVAGGDGTINEVVNGMAGSNVPLAIMPAGTANVLAMETGIGGNLLRAAARYGDLEPRDIALGRLALPGSEPRYFLLMAGLGLDARIVRLVDTGTSINDDPVVEFILEVTPDGAPAFDASTRGLVSRLDIPAIQPGTIVRVKYDPDQPSRVALDMWDCVDE